MRFITDLSFLIAEDQLVQRTLLANVLETIGAKSIHLACDGSEAMRVVRDSPGRIDIAIIDLHMPGMDGLELLRHLSRCTNNGVSVILVSAMGTKLLASVGAMVKAYGLPLLGCIEKPVTLGKLGPLISLHRRATTEFQSSDAQDVRVFDLEQIVNGLQNGEFEPHYQPQIHISSGRVIGAETLARWLHPEYGVVMPKAFIPILEQARALDELTLLMIRKSASDCAAWNKRGWRLRVSVNLSLVSLADTTLADRITDLVQSEGLETRNVILEITETAAMTEEAPALENLARLRMRGFGLSIDDYGTGFSTLRQLTRVPFTELKIDRSFVTGSHEDALSTAIMESSIDMAHRLGIETVAEGVETAPDLKVLQELGCEHAQGYFLGRPMSSQSFIRFCQQKAQAVTHEETHGTVSYWSMSGT